MTLKIILDNNPVLGLYTRHPASIYEGRLISVVRRWGGQRWPVGVSEMRRNKPIGGPSRLVPAHLRASRGPSMGGLTTSRGFNVSLFRPPKRWIGSPPIRKKRLGGCLKGRSTGGLAEQTYKHRARSAGEPATSW